MKVLISMLYECTVVNEIILYKLNPDKTIIITVKEKEGIKAALDGLKKTFSKIAFEVVYVDEFDVVGITKKLNRIIKREKNNQIYLNVTEGRKTMFLAGTYAASLNKDLVEGAFYLRQDNNKLMPIPLPDFTISKNKISILESLDKGTKDVNKIKQKLRVHRSLVYASLKDLVRNGHITKELELTDSGKICLISPGNPGSS